MSDKKFPPIQQRLMEFIRHQFQPGYNHYNVSKLIGDASARQYFRYTVESGDSFILAAYPESFDEARFPYLQVYQLLKRIDLPVPKIEALDGRLGIVLQQDLGNVTLQKHFLNASEGERRLRLQQAIDYIVAIQKEGTTQLREEDEANQLAFDEEKLSWELGFFVRHFLGNYRGYSKEAPAPLHSEFVRLARNLAGQQAFLCHRDYHIRNLMLLAGQLYVIDFQDARWGPRSYDLVSLLKDSIELSSDEIETLIHYYLDRFGGPAERDEFRREFHLMAIQRLLKALGTYGYQVVVRENFIYEQYMAGSLKRALISLDALNEFPSIRAVIHEELQIRLESS